MAGFFSLACSCLGLVQKSLSHDRAGGVVAGEVYSALLWPKREGFAQKG